LAAHHLDEQLPSSRQATARLMTARASPCEAARVKAVVGVGVIGCLLASCMTPVMTFGEGKSAKQAQRDTMHELGPAQLSTSGAWRGDVTTKKIRVWADRQYRTQNVRWQQSFEGPLELANLVLGSSFGVRLVPEYVAWDRHEPGSTLTDDIHALAARDPGNDVFLVVGLTSALPLVSATFDDLGVANLGGRHLIVRGYADLEERKLYEEVFRDLLPEEREMSLQQRREHKTAVVLLHEIAHALGADHDPEEETIMSAVYSNRASEFSGRAREAMLNTVDARLGRGGATAAAPPVTKPAATSAAPPTVAGGPLTLHVNADGQVLLGDKRLDATDVDNLLEDTRARDPNIEIVIKRARKAPMASLEQLVDRAKAIGFARVSITMY